MTNRSRTLLGAIFITSAATAHAQRTSGGTTVEIQSREPGRIRGIAYDSLLMKPVAGASVTLLTGAYTVKADEKGRFGFDNVAIGPQIVAFSTPELDSLGLGTLGASINVRPNETVRLTVATPSLRTLVSRRCGAANTLGSDSGVVWGTVRDAASNAELDTATAEFNWYDLKPGTTPGLLIRQLRKSVKTDASGMFVACGLPSDIVMSTETFDEHAASGMVQYAIGVRRLHRQDFLVSRDMLLNDSVPMQSHTDSVMANRARGTATLRGTVVDGKQRTIDNAIIDVASVDTTVRSGKQGKFLLSGLPAGTHTMQVRRVGQAPVTHIVNLRSDSTTDINIVMSDANVLTTVNVRAQLVKGADRTAYEFRRKMGFGYFIEGAALQNRMDLYSALGNIPGVDVRRGDWAIEARMKSTGMNPVCHPAIFLDGLPSDLEVADMRPPSQYRAIEVYTSGGTTPLEYSTLFGCGAILFWSRNAQW